MTLPNFCILADIARSKDIRNIYVLYDQLSRLLHQDSKSGKLKMSMKSHTYLQQLYCLEDIVISV